MNRSIASGLVAGHYGGWMGALIVAASWGIVVLDHYTMRFFR